MEDDLATNPAPEQETLQPAPEVAAEEPEVIEQPELETEPAEDIPAEEFEEVEHAGKKYSIPKELKPLLMFQQDYTKKTTELAEGRTGLETERQTFAQQQKALEEHIVEVGTLMNVDQQLARFDKVDWKAWNAQDPVATQAAWIEREQLRQHRDQLAGKLHQDYQQRTEKQQREYTAKLAAGAAVLAKEIPNWTPERGKTLAAFATSTYGLSAERVNGYTDPGEVRALNDAYLWRQHVAKQRAAAGKPAVEAQPVPQVGARRAPASNEPKDSDSIEVWNRKMDAREAKRRANG